MFRKSIALILAVCFSLLCLTGCSNSTPSSSVSDAASIANTTDSSADNSSEFDYPSYVNPTGLPITDEPVTLRIMVNNSAEQPDFGAVSCFQEMERRTGVKIIWENIPAGTAAEKVNMAFASGDLPDVFLKCGNVLNNTTLQRFAQEGQIYNLNQGDNLKRYSPNFYEFYQSSETVQAALTFEDGGVYSFPQGVEFSGNKVAGKMFVNTEWLERVGKEMPTTTEELYDVLVAFRDQDANGNGDPNDEIPFVPANFEYCQYGLAGAFGFSNRGLHDLRVDMDEATGKIRMTNTSDNYKNFLEYCQKLYDEGLLDNEIFTQQLANVTAKASEDRIGVYISTNLAAIPTNMWDKWKGLDVALKGPEGYQYWFPVRSDLHSAGAFVITSACKTPEVAQRWADYFFSDEGQELLFRGVIGEDSIKNSDGSYTWGDDVQKRLDEGIPLDSAIAPNVVVGGYNPVVVKMPYFYGGEGLSPALEAAENMKDYYPETIWPLLTFTPEESERTSVILADINSYVNKMRAEFVTGKTSFDEWDSYVNQFKAMGSDELLEIYTAALERCGMYK